MADRFMHCKLPDAYLHYHGCVVMLVLNHYQSSWKSWCGNAFCNINPSVSEIFLLWAWTSCWMNTSVISDLTGLNTLVTQLLWILAVSWLFIWSRMTWLTYFAISVSWHRDIYTCGIHFLLTILFFTVGDKTTFLFDDKNVIASNRAIFSHVAIKRSWLSLTS